jgi:hypothetical protein
MMSSQLAVAFSNANWLFVLSWENGPTQIAHTIGSSTNDPNISQKNHCRILKSFVECVTASLI